MNKPIQASLQRHRHDYSGSYEVCSRKFHTVDDAKAWVIERMSTRYLVYGIIDGPNTRLVTGTDDSTFEDMNA